MIWNWFDGLMWKHICPVLIWCCTQVKWKVKQIPLKLAVGCASVPLNAGIQRRVGGSHSLGTQIINATNLIQVNPNSFIFKPSFIASASTECSQCWPLSVALVLPDATPWSRWPSCTCEADMKKQGFSDPPNSHKKNEAWRHGCEMIWNCSRTKLICLSYFGMFSIQLRVC